MGDDVEIQRHSVQLPGTLDQVAKVRRMLVSCLGAEHPCLDDARLLASEAASNALTHSASAAPGGQIAVIVEWTQAWVMVSVADQGAAGVPHRLRAEPYDISGRGVDLIDALSECWGFTRRRAAETRVWFELSAHPDGAGQRWSRQPSG